MAERPSLLADIGGTNTRVALEQGGVIDRATIRRYANAENPDLSSILRKYLAEVGVTSCKGACVAVAGPVQDGRAEMTNLDWVITPEAVAEATGATRVAIINDLQAQGHALDRLKAESLRQVLPGAAVRRPGARLVVGVGTGFNAAPVHKTRRGLLVAASERAFRPITAASATITVSLPSAQTFSTSYRFSMVTCVLPERSLTVPFT